MKNLISILSIVLLAAPVAVQAAATVGQPAPAFTVTDIEGKEHSLADFKGKYVVLEWTNFECPFVEKHYGANNMQELQKEFTGKDVTWLMISSSAKGQDGSYLPEKWAELIEEKKAAPTAVLLDEDGKVGREYGATATPHMYVIDPEGKLIYAGAIDSIKSADQADIEKADNYIRTALNAAMNGKEVNPSSTKPYGCSIKYAK